MTGAGDDDTIRAAWQELRELVLRRSLGARASFGRFALAAGLSDAQQSDHAVYQALERLDYESALTLIDADYAGTTA